MPGLFQTKGTDLTSMAEVSYYARSSEGLDEAFFEFYGGSFKAFLSGVKPTDYSYDRETEELIHSDYLHAQEECGFTNSEFTRASTMVGLGRGILLSRGYKFSEILAGKVSEEEKKQVGREVLESFYSPKACGKLFARVVKAYSAVDFSQEIPLATGKTCATKDDLRAAVSTPEGKMQMAGVLDAYANGAQEVRQSIQFLAGDAMGMEFHSEKNRGNETYAAFAEEMSDEDQIGKFKIGVLSNTVGLNRLGFFPQYFIQSKQAQEQYQGEKTIFKRTLEGDWVSSSVAQLDETLEQFISQGTSVGKTKFYPGKTLKYAAAEYEKKGTPPKDMQTVVSAMTGFGAQKEKVIAGALKSTEFDQFQDSIVRDIAFSRLSRDEKEKIIDEFTPGIEADSKEGKALKAETLRPDVFKSRNIREQLASREGNAVRVLGKELQRVGLSKEKKDTLTAFRNESERRKKYLDISLREPLKEANRPEEFTTEAKFSPAFKAAFLKATDSTYMQEALSELTAQNPTVLAGIDARDFLDLKLLPGHPEQERKEAAKAFLQDYVSGDPVKREKCLDMFYDMYDSIDPLKFDLSCLSSTEEPTGPDMTDSEKDLLTFMEAWKFEQGSEMKMKENPSYLARRYPTTADQIRFRTKQDLFDNYATVLPILYGKNGLQSSGGSLDDTSTKNMQRMPEISGNVISFSTAHYTAQMRLLDEDKDTGSVDMSKNIDADFGVKITDDSVGFLRTFGVMGGSTAEKDRAELGLDELDMVYIDGKSAKEKYAGMSESDIKDHVMDDLCSGEHRVEMATLLKEKDGTFRVNVSSVKPNLHALDEIDKGQRSAARRFFDFGATKIETRADKSDKLWAKDPEGKDRKEGIRADLGQKILSKVSEKKKKEFEEQKAKQEAVVKQAGKEAAAVAKQKEITKQAGKEAAAVARERLSVKELEKKEGVKRDKVVREHQTQEPKVHELGQTPGKK